MVYAIIDTAALTLIQAATRRHALTAEGDVVNTRNLPGLKMAQLVTLYNHVTGEQRKGFPSLADARQKVAKAIEARATVAPPQAKTPTEGPVARVWAISDRMKGAARKDVIAACVAEGVNVNTAKTQYQKWFSKKNHH